MHEAMQYSLYTMKAEYRLIHLIPILPVRKMNPLPIVQMEGETIYKISNTESIWINYKHTFCQTVNLHVTQPCNCQIKEVHLLLSIIDAIGLLFDRE